MIDLKRMQRLFSDNRNDYGPYNTYPHIVKTEMDRTLLHVVEELGEIAKAWRKSGYQPVKDPALKKAIEEEIADVVILAGLFAVGADVDMDKAVSEKLHANYVEGKVLQDVTVILAQEFEGVHRESMIREKRTSP